MPDLFGRASRLLAAGAYDAALRMYQDALATDPGVPDAWYNVGFLRHRAGDFQGALTAYEEALRRGISEPEQAYLNRSVILADHLARYDAAERELQHALRVRPDFLPAWLNLANLHEQLGERDAALRDYTKVLDLQPAHPLALARLPGLMNAISASDPLLDDQRTQLRRLDTPIADRTELAFGLGKALDRAGLFDEAFETYTLANRLSLQSVGGRRYAARSHERLVDFIIAGYPAAPAADPAAEASPRMIFICGMFRSGSTLVEQILGSHPDVDAGGELPFIPRMAAGIGPGAGSMSDDALDRARTYYLQQVRQAHPSATIVTDKRPDNFLHLGLIRRPFPDATIVHTRRHPIDNCLSVYFLHLDQGMRYALDLEDIAHWYGQYRRLMAHWTRTRPDGIVEVHYDRLVSDPERVIAQLLERCGLPWSDACLKFHESKIVVKTPSAWQVRHPLYVHSSGRWRHYERHLGPLIAGLAPWLGSDPGES